MTISEKIFQLLELRGMSQREFAEKTGIAPSSISDWKRKHTNPIAEKILIICQVLNVSPEELLSGTDTVGVNSKKDSYMVLSCDSELGRFVMDVQSLPSESRGRLLGYLGGLKDRGDCKERLPLPIGVSDYRLASTEYYYIDKTMMIKEFLDERPMVSLFTRPRRFGKTLNMDMLRVFFEKKEEDTSVYFRDKMIWQCGERYRSYQGKYPVIFISFKDVKKDTWEETFEKIAQLILLEYKRHEELSTSEKVQDLDFYQKLRTGEIGENLFDSSLYMLSKMLHEHYGVAPIIIIDEYDIPIQQGYVKGYYDKVILFMRNLFSGCFKDNPHLSFGFMTGILRVSKESIFSGLNNLTINSVLDNKYREYFGFTKEEVIQMCRYYNQPEKFQELCEWYDGYRFGKTDIFNPWSVINYFHNECVPRAFWQSTGSNDIIGEVIREADQEIYERLTSLIKGEPFTTHIDTSVIYPQIRKNPSTIYSFLLVAGYLKVNSTTISYNGDFLCEVSLPNKEIAFVYVKEIMQQLESMISQKTAIGIQEAIYTGEEEKLQIQLEKLLLESVSVFDTVGENFYHGFMLGLCALLENAYVTSNRESGEGRYDIQLMPKNEKLPGILIELKHQKNATEDELVQLSQMALKQMEEKRYDAEMQSKGIKSIYKYGIAFSGKRIKVAKS